MVTCGSASTTRPVAIGIDIGTLGGTELTLESNERPVSLGECTAVCIAVLMADRCNGGMACA